MADLERGMVQRWLYPAGALGPRAKADLGIDGGGRTWPGRPGYLPRLVIGRTNRDIDATEHILDVFARHARGKN